MSEKLGTNVSKDCCKKTAYFFKQV